jgi:hypothetical protein
VPFCVIKIDLVIPSKKVEDGRWSLFNKMKIAARALVYPKQPSKGDATK